MAMINKWILGGVAAGAASVIIAVYMFGCNSCKESVLLEWEKDKVRHLQEMADLNKEHREIEKRWAESVKLIVERMGDENEQIESDYQDALDAVRSGTVILRDDLRGCEDRLSAATRSTGGDTGRSGGGLSGARQRVALRIGADADRVVAKLRACQSYVRSVLDEFKKDG